MKMHKPMGLDEMHSKVLREMVDEVAKPLSIILEKLWQTGEVPTDCTMGNINPIFIKGKKSISCSSFIHEWCNPVTEGHQIFQA